MRARINNHIAMIVVRQINVFGVAAEGELQNAHPGKTKPIAQLLDIWSNHAEVLGDDRQISEGVSDRGKEFPARHLDPTSTFGCGIATGNFPARGESAKVIDARD